MSVEVRRVAESEWRELRALRLAALAESPSAFLRTHAEQETLPDQHWHEVARGGTEGAVFVAALGQRLVGMAGSWFNREEERVELWGMWLEPAVRGGPAAAELIDAVSAWAGSSDASELFLEVERENARAIRLYERCGFVRTGVEREYPVAHMGPTIEMRRSLGEPPVDAGEGAE